MFFWSGAYLGVTCWGALLDASIVARYERVGKDFLPSLIKPFLEINESATATAANKNNWNWRFIPVEIRLRDTCLQAPQMVGLLVISFPYSVDPHMSPIGEPDVVAPAPNQRSAAAVDFSHETWRTSRRTAWSINTSSFSYTCKRNSEDVQPCDWNNYCHSTLAYFWLTYYFEFYFRFICTQTQCTFSILLFRVIRIIESSLSFDLPSAGMNLWNSLLVGGVNDENT